MNVLYFDTSTDWIVVQVWNLSKKEIIYSFKESCPRKASYRLALEIQNSLIRSSTLKPDLILIAKGPGSFTGIRITVTTARNLSQLWNIPCYGIDTLEIYMTYYLQKLKLDHCLIAIDGRMNKFFLRMTDAGKSPSTQDLTLLEIKEKLLNLDNGQLTIISNTSIDLQRKILDMNTDYPDIQGTMLSKKLDFLLDSSKFKEYDYTTLLPNYMRGTYVD